MKKNSEQTQIGSVFDKLVKEIGDTVDFELPDWLNKWKSMPYTFIKRSCKCGSSCLNKPFQHLPVKKMKLIQTEKCGSGIVADEDIKQGEFVQFGADQDCHCGAVECRRKLGVRPTKPKMSSDVALKLVAYQVYQNGGLHVGRSHVIDQPKCSHNCIGEVIRINHPLNERCFGIIRRFDKYSRKHTIMFEDGGVEFIDLVKEDWELVRL